MFKQSEQIEIKSPSFSEVVSLTERIKSDTASTPVVGKLIKAYWGLDTVSRYHVIVSFIENNREDVLQFLIKVLAEDKSELIRHEAAFGIGQMGDPTSQLALVDSLKRDPSAVVRHEAAIALATAGDEGCVSALREALGSTNDEPVVTESVEYSLSLIVENSK